jgi:hypothetical protein
MEIGIVMDAKFGYVGARASSVCRMPPAGDAGSSPHILSVWGSLGILRCAQLAPGAAIGARCYQPIGHPWPNPVRKGYATLMNFSILLSMLN